MPILASLLALAAAARPSQAGERRTFTIDPGQGYGVDACSSGPSSCRTMANVWCTTMGMHRAVAWGSADDITGSTGQPAGSIPAGAVLVTCGD